jgi:hypothetical protein
MKRDTTPFDHEQLSIEIPEHWEPIYDSYGVYNKIFDTRVRLMMRENNAEMAMLIHIDGQRRINVLGEWR